MPSLLKVARSIAEQEIWVVVDKPGTRIATLSFKEIVYFLNFVVLCPRCGRQNTADRNLLYSLCCRGDEVAEVLLHLLHICVFRNSIAVHDSQFVSVFADVAPLDGY